jgi:hypothetical protein
MSCRLQGKVCVITGTGPEHGPRVGSRLSCEGALLVGCDLSADAAQATLELVRRLTGPAGCQALVGLALGRSAGSTSSGGMKVW